MGFDPVSYAMGAKAGGGGGGVTVEPLTVTENGTYTAPSGKAYTPVTVAVPGLAIVETTFTSATQSVSVVIPLPPKQRTPFAVEIITPVNGVTIDDFPLGDVISVTALPMPDDALVYKRSWSGLLFYRNAASGRTSIPELQQKPSNTSIVTSGEYKIQNDEFFLTVSSNGRFPQGVTYSVKCYYEE